MKSILIISALLMTLLESSISYGSTDESDLVTVSTDMAKGAVVGALAGQAVGNDTSSTIIGAGIGAAVGGAYSLFSDTKDKKTVSPVQRYAADSTVAYREYQRRDLAEYAANNVRPITLRAVPTQVDGIRAGAIATDQLRIASDKYIEFCQPPNIVRVVQTARGIRSYCGAL